MKRDQITPDAIQATGPLAVGYVRVAAVPQANPRSRLDAQIGAVRAVAEAEGIELVRVFEDAGESAHNTERPGLSALLAAVHEGRVTVIIAPDLTRLARDSVNLRRLTDSFTRRGVSLVSSADIRGV